MALGKYGFFEKGGLQRVRQERFIEKGKEVIRGYRRRVRSHKEGHERKREDGVVGRKGYKSLAVEEKMGYSESSYVAGVITFGRE